MRDFRQARANAMQRFGFGPEAMKKSKVCRVCGTTGDATERYCRKCRTVLPKETLFDLYKGHHLYCPICDTVVANTARFCTNCGATLRQPSFSNRSPSPSAQ